MVEESKDKKTKEIKEQKRPRKVKDTKDAPKEVSSVSVETKENLSVATPVVHSKAASINDQVKEVKTEAKTEVQPVPQEEKAKKVPRKKSKKSDKATISRGKRKESVARATVVKGKGQVRINHRSLESYYNNKYVRAIAIEPLHLLGDRSKEINVSITVNGGGVMGQAQAARNAIANALVGYFEDDTLKQMFINFDRTLLIEDVRRVESKKYKGPKARARYQKSYR
ncbi:MAG: 30S ribosomal protein S9 [Candidatus Micrarchaeota archaeon]